MGQIDHYEIQINWDGNNVFAESEAILDTQIVGSIDVRYGFTFQNSRHGRLVSGRLSCTVLDPDRVYDPTNSNSPLYTDTLPGRTVVLNAVSDGGTKLIIWVGQIVSLVPIVRRDRPRTIRIVAYGISWKLQTNVSLLIAPNIRARDAGLRVLDEIDIASDIADSDSNDFLIGLHGADETAASALQRIEGSTMGLFYEDLLDAANSPAISYLSKDDLDDDEEPSFVIALDGDSSSGQVVAEYYTVESNSRGVSNQIRLEALVGEVSATTDTINISGPSMELSNSTNSAIQFQDNRTDKLYYFDDLGTGIVNASHWDVERLNGSQTYGSQVKLQIQISNWATEITNNVNPFDTFNDEYGSTNASPRLIGIRDGTIDRQQLEFVMFNPWSSNWPNVNDIAFADHNNDPQTVEYTSLIPLRYYILVDHVATAQSNSSQSTYGVLSETILAFADTTDDADDLADDWLEAYEDVQFVHYVTFDATNNTDLIAPRFDDRVRLFDGGESIGDFAIRGVSHRITQGGRCVITLTLIAAATYTP